MNDHARHMEFHNQQQAAMQRLRQHVLSCVPSHWRVATLELDVGGIPQMGIRSIRHRLHNPATGEEIDDLTQEVFDDTHALHTVFAEFDQAWRRCHVTFELDGSGRMVGVAGFEPTASSSRTKRATRLRHTPVSRFK